jgi:hypothetical protein
MQDKGGSVKSWGSEGRQRGNKAIIKRIGAPVKEK